MGIPSQADSKKIDSTGTNPNNPTQIQGEVIPNSGTDIVSGVNKTNTKSTNLDTPNDSGVPFTPAKTTVPKRLEDVPFIIASPCPVSFNTLTSERFLVAGSGISIIDNGAKNSLILSVDESAFQVNYQAPKGTWLPKSSYLGTFHDS